MSTPTAPASRWSALGESTSGGAATCCCGSPTLRSGCLCWQCDTSWHKQQQPPQQIPHHIRSSGQPAFSPWSGKSVHSLKSQSAGGPCGVSPPTPLGDQASVQPQQLHSSSHVCVCQRIRCRPAGRSMSTFTFPWKVVSVGHSMPLPLVSQGPGCTSKPCPGMAACPCNRPGPVSMISAHSRPANPCQRLRVINQCPPGWRDILMSALSTPGKSGKW